MVQAKNKKITSKAYTVSAMFSEWCTLKFVTLVPKPRSYSENEVLWTVLWLTSYSWKPAGSATSGSNCSAETGDEALYEKKKSHWGSSFPQELHNKFVVSCDNCNKLSQSEEELQDVAEVYLEMFPTMALSGGGPRVTEPPYPRPVKWPTVRHPRISWTFQLWRKPCWHASIWL